MTAQFGGGNLWAPGGRLCLRTYRCQRAWVGGVLNLEGTAAVISPIYTFHLSITDYWTLKMFVDGWWQWVFFGICGDFFPCKQGELSSSGSSLLLNTYRGGESRPSLKVVVVSFWKKACWLSCCGLYKGQYYYHACMANMKLELVNSTIQETDKQRAWLCPKVTTSSNSSTALKLAK